MFYINVFNQVKGGFKIKEIGIINFNKFNFSTQFNFRYLEKEMSV